MKISLRGSLNNFDLSGGQLVLGLIHLPTFFTVPSESMWAMAAWWVVWP